MPVLLITLSDGSEVRHVLGNRAAVIGREATCDIPIEDASASRRHARFVPGPDGFVVEDLESKNGTLVNDLPCTPVALRDGDRISIGSALAIFRESPTESQTSVVISDDLTQSHATHYVGREQRLALSQKRLEMIYEMGARLTTLQSQDQLFENAMDVCTETLQFERGVIGIRRRDSRVLDWPVVRHLRGPEGELKISRTLLNRALEHGERAVFADDGMCNTDPTVSMVQQGIRSAMCVPLVHGDETLGIIYGDRVSTSASYTNEDMDFLAGIAQQLAIGLINCRLMEDQKQMVQLERDIELARSIQTELFPADLPHRATLKIAALNNPGHRVSGDYYDVIETGDGRVWCVMADVTGEGMPAALLMANLQAAARVTIKEGSDPGTLLAEWNHLIHANTDSSKFITCLLVVIEPKEQRVQVASAGHHLPLVLRGTEEAPEELVADSGLPLGVSDTADFPTASVNMGPDPYLLFTYTDGVIEAMNADQQMFGTRRLIEALVENRQATPQRLVKQVRKSVATFAAGARQSDDITMLAVRVG